MILIAGPEAIVLRTKDGIEFFTQALEPFQRKPMAQAIGFIELETLEDTFETHLVFHRFGSDDPALWSPDCSFIPVVSSKEDEQATDWEVYEQWS